MKGFRERMIAVELRLTFLDLFESADGDLYRRLYGVVVAAIAALHHRGQYLTDHPFEFS